MYEGHGLIRQFQQGPRHMVAGGNPAVLHHLANAVHWIRLHCGAGLKEVIAQAEAHNTSGWVDVKHAGSHLSKFYTDCCLDIFRDAERQIQTKPTDCFVYAKDLYYYRKMSLESFQTCWSGGLVWFFSTAPLLQLFCWQILFWFWFSTNALIWQ